MKRFLSAGERVALGLFGVLLAALFSGCVAPQGRTNQAFCWRTVAGQPGGLGNVDGRGAGARFCQPVDVALDAEGNLYVADYYNYVIRKVSQDGSVTTLAGCVGEPGGLDGTGNSARFDRPQGVVADASGNVYVADSGNHTVRKVSPDGVVSTLAGRAGEQGSADGAGREARFRSPHDVAVDGNGNVYVSDANNHVIRKITSSGQVTTLAGKVEIKNGAAVGGHANGAGAAAKFRSPRGLALDGAGNLYVADTDNAVVRKVTPAGVATTLAGCAGAAGYANGTGAVVRFSAPYSVALDGAGNVFVGDAGNQVLRKITPAGMVSTVTNGAARFVSPRGIASDKGGTLYIADNDAQTVSKLTPSGSLSVLAGSASRHGSVDGPRDKACFNRPCAVVANGQGNLIVVENFNQTVRRVAPDGAVTTLAGRVWTMGGADGKGTNVTFSWPAGAARDKAGNVYVADAGNHTIRRLAPDGTVTTLAGSAGAGGATNGVGGKARFSSPSDVAADEAGNLYVADRGNHAVRRISPDGEVTTLAGCAGKPGRADGAAGAARFNAPSGVAVDPLGNVYVADTGNHTVRKIVPGGQVTTLAGCAGMKGGLDGVGAQARFNGPSDLAVEPDGSVYVADRDNHMIRKLAPDGRVTTVGGQPNVMSGEEGVGAEAHFAQPSGLALDASGVLYVADACNNRIVAGYRSGSEPKNVPVSAEAAAAEVPYGWSVLAGQPGAAGAADGHGSAARFNGPQGLALAEDGALLVAEGAGRCVRRVTVAGEVGTLAGTKEVFAAPVAVCAGAKGACYVSDVANGVWKVTASGEAAVYVGSLGKKGSADGRGAEARFSFLPGIAADAQGNVYVCDCNNRTVRKIAVDGVVTTFAGRAGSTGSFDGKGNEARFMEPTALAVDEDGNVFVADGRRIRKITPERVVTTVTADARLGRLDGIACGPDGTLYAADRKHHVIWRVSRHGAVAKLGGSELAMGGSGWLITGLAVDRAGSVYVTDAVRHCVMTGTPQ